MYSMNLCDSTRTMDTEPMKIELRTDRTVIPIYVANPRQIPLHWRSEARCLLTTMVDAGILRPVTSPRTWCSPVCFVRKGNEDPLKLRLTNDFRVLNSVVLRIPHPFPSVKEIKQNIRGDTTYLISADFISGYHQIKLDEDSRHLTAFASELGTLEYCVVPQGLSVSGDVFCRMTDSILADIDHLKLIDNILVQSATKEGAIETTREILERCREFNVTLSSKKLKSGKKLSFAGFVIDCSKKEGPEILQDPKKTQAIMEWAEPRNKAELQSFLGAANQLSSWTPCYSHVATHLRKLTSKEAVWTWDHIHQLEFDTIKSVLSNTDALGIFSIDKDTVAIVDGSRLFGLGWCLVQKQEDGTWKLIACGSRALTKSEAKWSVFEIKLLAAKFCLIKAAFWLRGAREFKIFTDHRALVGIESRIMTEQTSERIRKMVESMSAFNYQVVHVKGRQNKIADFLSRNPKWDGAKTDVLQDKEEDGEEAEEDTPARIRSLKIIKENLGLKKVKEIASRDNQYQEIVALIRSDKPTTSLPADHLGRLSAGKFNEMSLLDNDEKTLIIVEGVKIFLPEEAAWKICKEIHEKCHSAGEKTIHTLRKGYFFPGMRKMVFKICKDCLSCLKNKPLQNKGSETENPEPISSLQPWEFICLDNFVMFGWHHLICVDRMSGYTLVNSIGRETTDNVIGALETWFAIHGLPRKILSDGGSCFTSKKMRDFTESLNITHVFSSPENPESNGQSESSVKKVKNLAKTTNLTVKNLSSRIQLSLSQLNNMAAGKDLCSPAEAFFGRTMRTLSAPLLEETTVDRQAAANIRQAKHEKRKEKSSSKRRPVQFTRGDRVVARCSKKKTWTIHGTVIEPRVLHNTEDTRSYNILVDEGKYILWRNEKFLRHIPTSPLITRKITGRRSAIKPPSSVSQYGPWNRRHTEIQRQLFPDSADSDSESEKLDTQQDCPVKRRKQRKTVSFSKERTVFEI